MIRRFLIVTGLLVTFGSSFFGVSTMSEAEVKKMEEIGNFRAAKFWLGECAACIA